MTRWLVECGDASGVIDSPDERPTGTVTERGLEELRKDLAKLNAESDEPDAEFGKIARWIRVRDDFDVDQDIYFSIGPDDQYEPPWVTASQPPYPTLLP